MRPTTLLSGLPLRPASPAKLTAALALAALLLAPPLHAQDPNTPPPPGWSFDHVDNGLAAPDGYVSTSPLISGAWGQAFAPDGASVAGPVTAWFRWGGPGLSPPLYTRWSASASGDPYSPGGSVTVDDGLGDEPVPNYYGAMPGSMISSGMHLRQAGKGTQIGGVVSAGTVSPSATGSGPANVYVSVGVTLDTRGLTISRENAGPQTTDGDGTKYGDTTYSWVLPEIYYLPGGAPYTVDVPQINWQVFHPQFQGNWGLSVQNNYSWSPDETSDTWNYGTCSMPYRRADDAATQYTVSYTATDQDGATATAKYVLTVHDPVDNWHTDPSMPPAEYDIEAIGSCPPGVSPSSDIIVTYPPLLAQYDVDSGQSERIGGAALTVGAAVAPFFQAFLGPYTIPLTTFLAASGYTAGTWADTTPMSQKTLSSNGSHFNQDVSDQVSINAGNTAGLFLPTTARFADPSLVQTIQGDESGWYRGTPSNGLPGTWTVTAVAVLHKNIAHWIADTWDVAGNKGSTSAIIKYPGLIEDDGVRTWTYHYSVPQGQ